MLNREDIDRYRATIKKLHEIPERGYEKNDRGIFIEMFLNKLGYRRENILEDVSQKASSGSKIPDIRFFSANFRFNKHTHSEFVIETKNFYIKKIKL